MKASKLAKDILDFISTHGDVNIKSEYWCVDCQDFHKGNSISLGLTSENEMDISIDRIGED